MGKGQIDGDGDRKVIVTCLPGGFLVRKMKCYRERKRVLEPLLGEGEKNRERVVIGMVIRWLFKSD